MPTVLIVEDDAIIAWNLTEIVQSLGLAVVGTAQCAAHAVRLAVAAAPDLILMDIRLAGGSDGIAAAGEIRARTGKRVLYVTGNADAPTLEQAARTEPLGYVFKPFTPNVVRTAIERALGAPA